MKNIKYKILRFLIDGKAYSDNAIMKNFGVNSEELKTIYSELKSEGCLMSYLEYEEIEKNNKVETICMGKKNCESCPSFGKNCDVSKCQTELEMDKSKILVLTEKAFLIDEAFDKQS